MRLSQSLSCVVFSRTWRYDDKNPCDDLHFCDSLVLMFNAAQRSKTLCCFDKIKKVRNSWTNHQMGQHRSFYKYTVVVNHARFLSSPFTDQTQLFPLPLVPLTPFHSLPHTVSVHPFIRHIQSLDWAMSPTGTSCRKYLRFSADHPPFLNHVFLSLSVCEIYWSLVRPFLVSLSVAQRVGSNRSVRSKDKRVI